MVMTTERKRKTTYTTDMDLSAMVLSCHSMFHSLCSVPLFRSFHASSCSCVWFASLLAVHVGVLFSLYFCLPRHISRHSSVSPDTGILLDTGAICHDSP
jgi:hypothetical protein